MLRLPWLKTSSGIRRTVALFSFAETLTFSALLLRTWRPRSFTRCHCVTIAAPARATVTNVTKRFTRALPPFSTFPTEVFAPIVAKSEEHTSELQSRQYLVCRLLLEKKKKIK